MAAWLIPALLAGGSILGSWLAGREQSKAQKEAIDVAKDQLSLARDIYNRTVPSYGLLTGMYQKILEGDLSTPLYANPRSQIERATVQGLSEIRRNLARRGLGSSGLLAAMQQRLYANRARALGDLYSDLLKRAEAFTTTGVSLGLGQGLTAAGNLARQYSALAGGYGQLASGLGLLGGALLYRTLFPKAGG